MVVVTGPNGHIGANLVRRLLADGVRVRAVVHRAAAALDGLDVERVPGDVADVGSLTAAFAGADVVVHLAALISITGSQGGRVEAMNVQGAGNAAEAALAAGARRMVHVSSVHAFDHAVDPLTERNPRPGPHHSAYDRSKAAGEAAVREVVARGLDAVVVNPSGVIGPDDWAPSRMGRALLDLARGRMPALVDGGFDWVDARDVADGIVAAADRGRTGENYLLGGRWASMAELAQLVHAAGGARPPRLTTPRWLATATAPLVQAAQSALGQEPLFTSEAVSTLFGGAHHVDSGKAHAELGYAPRPLADTVADTLAFFRTRGWLA